MAEKSFNEVQRAMARPDVDDLLLDLDDYCRFQREIAAEDPNPGNYKHAGNFAAVMDAHWEDPDRGLAYVALAMSRYDDAHFLGVMAAGPLEDLLRDPSPEIADRIMEEARKTPRFRWMLSGVFLHAIAERVRPAIEKAVGGWALEQSLPPRPW
jgi:hypothetical protein